MYKPKSPWLEQLKRQIDHKIIDKDLEADICVVGGGIAGITTAYYLLKETNMNVILAEGYRIGHGATGHNAGQVVCYFEKDFSEIADEYGVDMASTAQKDIFSAWAKLEEIIDFANLEITLSKFIGYAGCRTHQQLLEHLEKKYIRDQYGVQIDAILIDKDYDKLDQIPEKYDQLFEKIDSKTLKNLLNVKTDHYIGCLATQKGTLNSSLFCEELLVFLLNKYRNRLKVFEHTFVETVNLYEHKTELIVVNKSKDNSSKHIITSQKVILCTNGYVNFEIIDHTQQSEKHSINHKFKSNLKGLIAYMGGYLEIEERHPTAISYFSKENGLKGSTDDSYFYLTRRKYELSNKFHTLTCIGGPDEELAKSLTYTRITELKKSHIEQMKEFLVNEYTPAPKNLEFDFAWHGLMGYTKNLLRIIGPEPQNPNLLYNLGCNGIGILPSVFGGWKISQFIQNKISGKSIFDPHL